MAPATGDFSVDLAESLGLKRFDSVPELLDEGIHILCICSPTAEHLEHTKMAASAGVHVLCDRPIALNVQQGREMIRATEDASVFLMIGHVLRFWPEYVAARDLLASGSLGEVLSITTSRVSGTLSPEWRGRLLDPRLGLGALEALIHDMDFFAWLLGMPCSIVAQGIKAETGAWGQIQCLLGFPGGGQGQAEASYLVPLTFPLSMYLRVMAERGTLVFDFRGALSSRAGAVRNLVLTRTGRSPELLEVPGTDAYDSEVSYFLRCLDRGDKPALGAAQQALLSLSMVLAAERSAANKGTFVYGLTV